MVVQTTLRWLTRILYLGIACIYALRLLPTPLKPWAMSPEILQGAILMLGLSVICNVAADHDRKIRPITWVMLAAALVCAASLVAAWFGHVRGLVGDNDYLGLTLAFFFAMGIFGVCASGFQSSYKAVPAANNKV